jgi:hypothetical protein
MRRFQGALQEVDQRASVALTGDREYALDLRGTRCRNERSAVSHQLDPLAVNRGRTMPDKSSYVGGTNSGQVDGADTETLSQKLANGRKVCTVTDASTRSCRK